MPEELYIYGAGGHAKVVAATARLCGYTVRGFWEDSNENTGNEFFGSRIVASEDIPDGANVFIAFGNNNIRLGRGQILQRQFHIQTIIHPSAQIAEGVELGIGTYIGALTNIDPDCIIGDFCIVNNLVNISHDSLIADGAHICAESTIAGHGKIGRRTFLGIGSCMIENREVGDDSIIGAGSIIIKNIPSNVTAVGIPARIIKEHDI